MATHMATNRERFRQWLNGRIECHSKLCDEIADAAAAIWEGPGEAHIKGGDGNWYVSRMVLGGFEYIQPDGSWEHNHAAYFPTRAAAEAALAQVQQAE